MSLTINLILEAKAIIKDYIVAELMTGRSDDSLEDGQSLIETSVIDSLGIMKLLTFIEGKFNIRVLDEELIPENFETIECITTLVKKKLISNGESI